MTLSGALAALGSMTVLTVVFHAVRPNVRSDDRLSLLLCVLGFGVAVATVALVHRSTDPTQVWFWHGCMAIGWTFYPTVVLQSARVLTRAGGRSRAVGWLLHSVSLAFMVQAVRGKVLISGFARGDHGWQEQLLLGSPWSVAFIAYSVSATVGGMGLVAWWSRHSAFPAERRQGRLISGTGLGTWVAAGLAALVTPWACRLSPTELQIIAMVGWCALAVGAAVRYRLLSRRPAASAGDILDLMTDAVLLIDGEERVVISNAAADELIGGSPVGRRIADLFPGEDAFPPARESSAAAWPC